MRASSQKGLGWIKRLPFCPGGFHPGREGEMVQPWLRLPFRMTTLVTCGDRTGEGTWEAGRGLPGLQKFSDQCSMTFLD